MLNWNPIDFPIYLIPVPLALNCYIQNTKDTLQSMRLGPNWCQIGNKTCYIPKVSNFTSKKDIYVDRLDSAIFRM